MAKVLVVDDEATVRSTLRKLLGRLGHEVWDAAEGGEALRHLEAVHFDLVITDVYMAAMDGMELLLRIQQRGLRVPVVVMSGGGFKPPDEVLAMASSCGAVATLDKPFTPEQLGEALEPLLEGPRAE
jgi:CheY-like chemotaxis protein